MKIIFLPQAKVELLDAIADYEAASGGLGQRFKDEANRCILWIAEHHELYRLRPQGYRRINLRVFPFHILFITRGSKLWILAVAHGSRKPEYWIDRGKSL